MTYLPASPATELATKADLADLRGSIDGLATESGVDLKHLSQRIGRLHTTMLGGFAAVLATGFLG